MNLERLQNRIALGSGLAARKIGGVCTVFRPAGIDRPLSERNRVIDLTVAFQPMGRATGAARDCVVWQAIYDSQYTLEGDYLVGDEGTFFVAMQRPALPVRCVLTNCVVTVMRPSFTSQGGYNGVSSAGASEVINDWPGCFTAADALLAARAGPVLTSNRTLLLPALPSMVEPANLISDEAGVVSSITSAERTAMGWRLSVRGALP